MTLLPLPDCTECRHPATNHHDGECWTAHGVRVTYDHRDQCDCWGYTTEVPA